VSSFFDAAGSEHVLHVTSMPYEGYFLPLNGDHWFLLDNIVFDPDYAGTHIRRKTVFHEAAHAFGCPETGTGVTAAEMADYCTGPPFAIVPGGLRCG
jgi:hypothetical protein